MPYCVIRQRGSEETSRQESEAAAAVQLLLAWSRDYPQQSLLVCDEQGATVAYRRPQLAALIRPAPTLALYP